MASADATHIPNEHHRVRLNTGDGMPTIGWGTYMINSDEIGSCIDYAIEAGYRHIDTAFAYDNEMAIGAGLQRLKKLGKVTRRELFITSKLWNTFHRPELVRPAFMQSLKYLQLDYLDLYLMHTPCAFALDVEHPGDMYPRHRDQTIRFDNTSDYVNTWLEMKKLFDDGLVRNIGVANLNIDQLKRIIATGTVPAVLQIECNPFCVQNDLWQFCAAHGIHVSAHSPLGAPSRLIGFDGDQTRYRERERYVFRLMLPCAQCAVNVYNVHMHFQAISFIFNRNDTFIHLTTINKSHAKCTHSCSHFILRFENVIKCIYAYSFGRWHIWSWACN